MRYCSVDIETTGLTDRSAGYLDNDIIEFGCVLDDLENPKPLKDLPTFHCYFIQDRYSGTPFALSMHPIIFRRIAEHTEGYNYYSPNRFGHHFKMFLIENGYVVEKDRVMINVAGKNFGSFDCPFLEEKTDMKKHVKMRHRFIDPGSLYMELNDSAVPGMETCLERAGLEPNVAHTAIEDAMDVVKLVRYKLLGKIE